MNIYINSKLTKVYSSTLFDLKSELQLDDEIIILNGFQTSSNEYIKENDNVFIIKKGIMPSKDDLENLMMARHTPNVFEKLKNSRVAIAGLGGLGSNVALMLARIGVGELFLVDFDIVEPSNLNRQAYFIKHLGMKKTIALKELIKEINPFIKVEYETIKVTHENVCTLFKDENIVCEAFDNPTYKSMIVNELLLNIKDIKIVSASGMAGFTSSNHIKTTNPFKNLYICGDLENEATFGNGLMAPRVQICAAHQANMIQRLILGIDAV